MNEQLNSRPMGTTAGNDIYIAAATHVSLQQPLTEAWLTEPQYATEPYARSVDPNFRDWLNPLESRRMGKLLKRALVTAQKVMADSGIFQPEAIITGTGLGCIENTELFLDSLCREGEQMLKPTHFMQSTHNTISSLIAIRNRCYAYNSTYSHKGVSFESALWDAYLQLRLGDIRTALVTANDELTPTYFRILQRTGYIGQPGQSTASEASVAMMLTTVRQQALCRLLDVRLWHQAPGSPLPTDTLPTDVDAVMLGTSGHPANDRPYAALDAVYGDAVKLHYKHLFGEGYSAMALGVYAAAHLLGSGCVPPFMMCGADGAVASPSKPLRNILVVNHSDGEDFSYVLLERVL